MVHKVRLAMTLSTLTTVDVATTSFTFNLTDDKSQHTGVTQLHPGIEDIMLSSQPPIIMHFPNLKRWRIWSKITHDASSTMLLKESVSKWYSRLTAIQIGTISGDLIGHIPIHDVFIVFIDLDALMIPYKEISVDLVVTLTRCPNKWICLHAYRPASMASANCWIDGAFQRLERF
ncbi:hypothetical protein BCR41DRAFT_16805 [Lobosporangium transversale]|uniref:Uncharacterized protein n=1 Tax=Lobosporangium transversale TaxID=64571 RepID=A0A1Y2GTR7_9FUNG|nr:hypothetical protein BCR41DRAFT_16805 [Lobosporangium transversale]ORZ22868.1 hypothetical protein BCR41DRAFT_16805 [Lobosporangium transversale]|eukprot:XP_021883422.1 hypothetical protein BCR41DRAFT_16805 [Lobosporangium transversale]